MKDTEKKLVLKTHWQKVLDVHADWLLSKGYQERLLEAGEINGKLVQRLKESMEEAIYHSLWVYRIEEFSVETSGLFEEKQDRVVFQFNYELDPSRERLGLMSLKATMDDLSLDFPIAGNRPADLPPAILVHKQLSTLGRNIQLNRIAKFAGQQPTPPRKGKTL